MRIHDRYSPFFAGAIALGSLVACMGDAPRSGTTEQAAVNPPLPAGLNIALNGTKSVTIGGLTYVTGDVASSGATGSVLFDVGASQQTGASRSVLAPTVTVRAGASVGTVYGNVITVEGTAVAQRLGLDPSKLPQVPAATPAAPGTTNVNIPANQARQLCAGQYGAIVLGTNATLNLNGGVYHMTRLSLGEGAKLEPSEPVVLVVSGNLNAGTASFIRPSVQVLNPMSPDDIRIEVHGAATLGGNAEARAHILVPNGKLTTLKGSRLIGAGWANVVSIAAQATVTGQDVFRPVSPSVPPACNDNQPCTVDQCIGGGTTSGMCSNTLAPSGSSCSDGNLCNGDETCNATGTCLPGIVAPEGTSCTDEDACNGEEVCNGAGSCVAEDIPVIDDNEACTIDTCDPDTGVSNEPLPDGSSCNGTGMCEAGVCSVQGSTFAADFIQGTTSQETCQEWNSFRSELIQPSYSSVTLSGSNDPIGVTCNEPALATQICHAMRTGTSLSVTCNGRPWRVATSCGGVEITTNSFTCSCAIGYSVRPCSYYSGEWGGINTSTCYGPSQSMSVVCR